MFYVTLYTFCINYMFGFVLKQIVLLSYQRRVVNLWQKKWTHLGNNDGKAHHTMSCLEGASGGLND